MKDRGTILDIELNKEIFFNGEYYSIARIEIDHINFGLCPKLKQLNKKRRSNFSPANVISFLFKIDGMDLVAKKVDLGFSFFALEMSCPVDGPEFGKRYRLIFTTSDNQNGIVGTVTLYRVK
jgi:hypothetical protein